jgi:hypothetical protein
MKYIVSLDDKSIEIDLDVLNEENLFNAVSNFFSLPSSSMKLSFVKDIDIWLLTIGKRLNTVLCIKRLYGDEEKKDTGIDIINTKLEKLLKGEISYFQISNVSKDKIDKFLVLKSFIQLESDYDSDIIRYYYAHPDWEIEEDGEYVNRLNLSFDISSLITEFQLELDATNIKEYKEKKLILDESRERYEVLKNELSILEDTIYEMEQNLVIDKFW